MLEHFRCFFCIISSIQTYLVAFAVLLKAMALFAIASLSCHRLVRAEFVGEGIWIPLPNLVPPCHHFFTIGCLVFAITARTSIAEEASSKALTVKLQTLGFLAVAPLDHAA
jgi:hypothetical protein